MKYLKRLLLENIGDMRIYSPHGRYFKPYDPAKPFDISDVEICRGEYGGFVAIYQNKPIGRVVGVLTNNDNPSQMYVTNIEVSAHYRKRGVGRLLYAAIKEYVEQEGKTLVPAPSLSDDAFEFWKKWNPEAVATDGRHWDNDYLGKEVTYKDRQWVIITTAQNLSGAYFTAREKDKEATCMIPRQVVIDQVGDYYA